MQTPDNEAGRLTELVMAVLRKNVPMNVGTYNGVYDQVYDVLKKQTINGKLLVGDIMELLK